MMNLHLFPKKDAKSAKSHLTDLSESVGQKHLNALFAEDPQRFGNFSIQFDEIIFDCSKQRIDQSVIRA
ncbi:MAG: glucose-6-phosphate isomerase, partial [Acinetobacter sp.]|nr:glucose-6-phosphate isomerase [Acinetobacter sp.]